MRNDAPDESRPPSAAPGVRIVRGLKRLLFLVLAGLLYGLGVLGAILPGLPATPFLLLASFFLVRSSPRLNTALLRSRFFGPILTDWQIHGGVQRHVKVQAVVAVVLAVALTIYLTRRSLPVSLVVVGLALIGLIVIWRLPPARLPGNPG